MENPNKLNDFYDRAFLHLKETMENDFKKSGTDGSSSSVERNKSRRKSGNQDIKICGVSSELLEKLETFSKEDELFSFLKEVDQKKEDNFKLPQLLQDGKQKAFTGSEKTVQFDLINSLPELKLEDIKIDRKSIKVMESMAEIEELEKRILISTDTLKLEREERLNVQEKMCNEICNDEEFYDKNASTFLNLCCYEQSSKNTKEKKRGCQKNNDDNGHQTQCHKSLKTNTKNFIQRNIELAATSMTKLPLTDDEKHQLEQILSDLDTFDQQNCETVNSEAAARTENLVDEDVNDKADVGSNSYHFSEVDKKRMFEIDDELDNKYTETLHLRSSNSDVGNNFWKSLVLDQLLKEVDVKIAAIKQEDVVIKNIENE